MNSQIHQAQQLCFRSLNRRNDSIASVNGVPIVPERMLNAYPCVLEREQCAQRIFFSTEDHMEHEHSPKHAGDIILGVSA